MSRNVVISTTLVTASLLWGACGPTAAETLSPKPKWLPDEPGKRSQYRFKAVDREAFGGEERFEITLDVSCVSVTHTADDYHATVHVVLRGSVFNTHNTAPEVRNVERDLEIIYKDDTLSIGGGLGNDIVCSLANVSVTPRIGDAISLSVADTPLEAKPTIKVESVATKVALGTRAWDDVQVISFSGEVKKPFWDPATNDATGTEKPDAPTVTVKYRGKVLMSSKDGLLRVTAGSAMPTTVNVIGELSTPRRPF
jgi:hypothetical protein